MPVKKYFLSEKEIETCIGENGKFQLVNDGIAYCSKCCVIEENEDFPETRKIAPKCSYFNDSMTVRAGETDYYFCSFDKE